MQRCLVFGREGLVAEFGSERDQRPIDINTTSFLIGGLAIGHLVVHVAQVAITFHRTVPPLSLFLVLLVEPLLPRCCWIREHEECSCVH